MNIQRTEIRTGLLVILSLAALFAVLLYLGAPGVFVPQNTFRIYADNAAGIREGDDVMLAGRKVGQVKALYSPVAESERPEPEMETRIDVSVASTAMVYQNSRVLLTQNGLLGAMLIDFSRGQESSGLAGDGWHFLAERPVGVADAVPKVLEAINPVLKSLTETLGSLQGTATNLAALTAPNSDLQKAIAEYKAFGTNLKELSADGGPISRTMANLEELTGDEGRLNKAVANVQQLTGKDSSLAKTLKNAENFTEKLSNNQDIDTTLRNFRNASLKLDRTVSDLGPQFNAIGRNLEEASATVKRQPWRLIWPTTKKDEPDGRASPPQPRLKVEPQKKSRRR